MDSKQRREKDRILPKMKKAITPLISTVLLLAFAIGLGTLVMSWGNSEKLSQIDSCNAAMLGITRIEEQAKVCLDGNSIKTVLENNGNVQINKVEMILLTKDSVIKEVKDLVIVPGEYSHIDFNSEITDSGRILKTRFIPYTDKPCINKKVEIEKIGEC
jgi:flagellin-like protein